MLSKQSIRKSSNFTQYKLKVNIIVYQGKFCNFMVFLITPYSGNAYSYCRKNFPPVKVLHFKIKEDSKTHIIYYQFYSSDLTGLLQSS